MQLVKKITSSTFSSLQIRNFRLYFTGQMISSSGTWMQNIAMGLLMLKLTGSGTALGILIALQFLPLLLFGSYGGVIADRYSKLKIFLIGQVLMGIIALLLAGFVYFEHTNVWIVYFLALCMGLVTAIENPTKHSFIFDMVGKDQIKNAVSLNSMMVNIARVIGPLTTAILVPTVGLFACFVVNAISYIAVIFFLLKIDTKKLHTGEKLTKIKGQVSKGLIYVKNTPTLRNTLILMIILGTFTYEFQVILPLLAEFTFHNAETGYAMLMTAMGMGAVFGALYSANRKKISVRSLIIIASIFGIFMLITSISPNLYLAALAMVAVGFISINFHAGTNAMLHLKSKPEMRGRVMSLWSIAFLGTTPIGGPIIGWIGETYGARWGMAVGGFAALLAAALVYIIRKRDEEQIITPEIELASDTAK